MLQGSPQGQERPAYVQFETRAIEDRAETAKQGHPAYKDTHYAVITAPGGNSTVVEKPAHKFLEQKRNDQFYQHYKAVYDAWLEGQDEPVEGTPLKMWPPITPAQLAMCKGLHIRTVEDLANAPEQALTKMGIGARALQHKAMAWLSSASGDGKVSEEMAALKRENEDLREIVSQLRESVQALKAESEAEQPAKRGPGRPKKDQQPANQANIEED